MKKLIGSVLVVFLIFSSLCIAKAMDLATAKANGYGYSASTPDGKVPLENGWNQASADWFYTSSQDESLRFKALGTIYVLTKVVSQIAAANCISEGRILYMNVSSGYITATGCLPQGGNRTSQKLSSGSLPQ